jgi:hypothetical protein
MQYLTNQTEKTMNQKERMLDYLQKNPTITSMEALNELGIFRAASRISELNQDGHNISRRMITVKNKYNEKCSVAQYTLGDFS